MVIVVWGFDVVCFVVAIVGFANGHLIGGTFLLLIGMLTLFLGSGLLLITLPPAAARSSARSRDSSWQRRSWPRQPPAA